MFPLEYMRLYGLCIYIYLHSIYIYIYMNDGLWITYQVGRTYAHCYLDSSSCQLTLSSVRRFYVDVDGSVAGVVF